VSAEMSLHVLAYNLKRVMKMMGTGPLIEALRAWSRTAYHRIRRRNRWLAGPALPRWVITQPRPGADRRIALPRRPRTGRTRESAGSTGQHDQAV